MLAGPGVIATLTFAPLVIALFYSAKFTAAVGILRWICLGMTLRVITWPMGFIIVAKGERKIFFFTELAWTVVNVSLSWICVRFFGLNGAGIAFFGSYVFHGFMIYPVVSLAQRFSLVSRKQTNGFTLPFLDRDRFLWTLPFAFIAGDRRRDIGGDAEQCLLD